MNRLNNLFLVLTASYFLFFSPDLLGENALKYTLEYLPNSGKVTLEIQFDPLDAGDVRLIIPRSAPGTYCLINYLAFTADIRALTTRGTELEGSLGDGSYFIFPAEHTQLSKLFYTVDVKRMEEQILDASMSSKARDNYLGLFGYSIFGFIEGQENKPIELSIQTDPEWPIFSTLAPSESRKYGRATFEVPDYALLADAQFLLGNAVAVLEVPDAPIPLYVATYSETPISPEEIGRRGKVALENLKAYFGYVPMPHYTMVYEFVKPVSDRHDYGFNMEHLNSMTANRDVSRPIDAYDPDANITSIVHHMGHSWLPLRSFGAGYRPFDWQIAPLIETIWLNEGFIWYIATIPILKNDRMLNWFQANLDQAPAFIKNKTLRELSLLGSTQYAQDFRIGKNLFSRGALMAYEMDVYIREQTEGKKSFRDALLGLLEWTNANQRAFNYEEIEPILSGAAGVNLTAIWSRWQQPMNH